MDISWAQACACCAQGSPMTRCSTQEPHTNRRVLNTSSFFTMPCIVWHGGTYKLTIWSTIACWLCAANTRIVCSGWHWKVNTKFSSRRSWSSRTRLHSDSAWNTTHQEWKLKLLDVLDSEVWVHKLKSNYIPLEHMRKHNTSPCSFCKPTTCFPSSNIAKQTYWLHVVHCMTQWQPISL